MEEIRETSYDWTTRDSRGYFSTNMKSEIRKMLNYASARPEEVTIFKMPEMNGGYLVTLVPKTWFSVKPPRKRKLTDEQRVIISKRMSEMRKSKG